MVRPVEWLNEFKVNLGVADNPAISDPQIIGLSSGRFLVAWTESGTTGVATQADTDIIGKIFDAEGNVVKDSFRLNTNTTNDFEDDFDIAATNDGGFMIVYMERSGNFSELNFERYEESGASNYVSVALPGANEIIATENIVSDFLANPQISVNNANNRAYITFTDDVGSDTDVRAVYIDQNGNVITPEFDAAQNSSDRDADADSAILTNGELVSIYEETDSGTIGLEFRIYNTGGVVQHSGTIDSGPINDPQVASLANGNWVATWSEANDVHFRIYTANGAAVTGQLNVAIGPNVQAQPEIAALPDGGFVIMHVDSSSFNLFAQKFNANGSLDGLPVIVENVFTITPNVGVTGDGRILFTWEQSNNVWASIWDPRDSTIDSIDYTGVNPPINFVNADEVITSRVSGTTTVNGDGGPDTLLGQNGNDVLNGGGGVDLILGRGGNDTINGGFTTDSIDAGSGNDLIIQGNSDNIDDVDGGSGTDTLDASGVFTAGRQLTITGVAEKWTSSLGGTQTFRNIENVIGTQLGDDIRLEQAGITNTIDGQGGNDTIAAGFNTDSVLGGSGDDLILINAGQNIDNIDGGSGLNDRLDMSDNVDLADAINVNLATTVFQGRGVDTTITNVEHVTGTQQADTIIGNAANNTLRGEDGNDTIETGAGTDSVFGGNGNDIIRGNNTFDIMRGGLGNDTFVFNAGDGPNFNINSADGDSGTDTIRLNGAGLFDFSNSNVDFSSIETLLFVGDGGTFRLLAEEVSGTEFSTFALIDGADGSGVDSVEVIFDSSDISMDLSGWTFTDWNNLDSGETVTITGNTLDNTITGTVSDDIISGGDGDDSLNGGDGFDSIDGGAGRDIIIGGAGSDTLDGVGSIDTISGGGGQDTINGGGSNDSITGDGGADSIDGDSGGDSIDGGSANDLIYGGNGNDTILGGVGNDIIYGEGFTDELYGGDNQDQLFGGGSSDSLYGGNGGDTLTGNNAKDFLFGEAGADSLDGGASNDEMDGGSGNDTLLGATGNDFLTGGTGADIFDFRANHGSDRILDFEDGIDIIRFDINAVQSIANLTITNNFAMTGSDVNYGTGTIRVDGVLASDLTSADFIFL